MCMRTTTTLEREPPHPRLAEKWRKSALLRIFYPGALLVR